MEAHFRKLERMYLAANLNKTYYDTTTVHIGKGVATIGLTIEEKYFHALGAIHGSVYFKLLDDAAFFAVNSIEPEYFVLTTSFTIQLIRPANSGLLRAEGKLKFQSRNLFVAEASLYNDAGKEIAFGTGNFAKSRMLLADQAGYN